MSTATQSVAQFSSTISKRPARALIGWLEPQDAALYLAGRMADFQNAPEHLSRAESARNAVAARPDGFDQSEILSDPPIELQEYSAALTANPFVAQHFLTQGYQMRMVDLRRVCSIQPCVFTDHAAERVKAVDSADFEGVASVALPLEAPPIIPAQQDGQRFMFSSLDANLGIAGGGSAQINGGPVLFGFAPMIRPSYLQVGLCHGRYFLRDGYHRAYGFLSRGITRVPAFFRSFRNFGEIGLPTGMFSESVLTSDRPPTLSDFFDDQVSTSVSMPATKKVIIIQAIELSLIG